MEKEGELDGQSFLQEIEDVKPLKLNQAELKKTMLETPGQIVRRSHAVESSVTTDPLMSAGIQNLKSNDVLAFRSDGVQHGVYKKLRMGHYEIDACLDLHRMTVEVARKEVYSFLNDCHRHQ